jgi:NADH-quinone oxidoreductase subunit N
MAIPAARDLVGLIPQFILAGTGMLVLLADAFWPRLNKRFLLILSLLGLIATGITSATVFWAKGAPEPIMGGMLIEDGYTAFFTLVLCVGTALSVLLSTRFLQREGVEHGEYYALLLFTTLGGVVMAAATNLICIFLGLEILSISLYILSGYQNDRLESDESALKYFLLGAFASAFFLYGIALVYGATGSVDVREIAVRMRDAASSSAAEPSKNFLLLSGLAALLVGFSFKVAVVPFHVWTPDVYEGAPTSVTAFMSVGAKVAGFAAFLRVMGTGFPDQQLQVQTSAVMASLAALTMLVGNVVAIVQTSVKRLLAYSSIAHAGYLLVGVVAAVRPGFAFGPGASPQASAVSAVLFYTCAYTVSNLGAFAVLLALRRRGEELREIRDFTGLAARYPLLAGLMALFLLSLAGLPPTPGFFGKLFLFNALISMNGPLVWLIVLFALTSVASFYYYLGLVRAMYMDKPGEPSDAPIVLDADWSLRIAMGLSAVATIVLGLWAGGVLGLAEQVATNLLAPSGPGGLNSFR